MLFPIWNVSYFYISTFWGTCAVPSVAFVCSCLMLWLPDTLLRFIIIIIIIVIITLNLFPPLSYQVAVFW